MSRVDLKLTEEDKKAIREYAKRKKYYSVSGFIRQAIFKEMRRNKVSLSMPSSEDERALNRFYTRGG